MKAKYIICTAVSVVCCLLTSCGSTKINVNNYLTTEVTGFDGSENAGWNVDIGQLVKDKPARSSRPMTACSSCFILR